MLAIPYLSVTKDPNSLKIREWPRPIPKNDEILIKVNYFGLNFADTVARKGQYPDSPPFPFVPGYEVSGIVVEIGEEIKKGKINIGDRVAALTSFGGYAEYVTSKEGGYFKLPETMSLDEGCSIPVVFTTAYTSIFHTGVVRKGDRILIHAAAGGVGLAAVQLAKNAGLIVYGTASNAEKLKMLKEEFGVDHVINYREVDFVEEIHKIHGKNEPCLDIILDSIGGDYLKKGISLLRPAGRIIAIGAASLSDRSWGNLFGVVSNVISMVTLSALDLLLNSRSFTTVNLKRIADLRPEIIAECTEEIEKRFSEGQLRTFVSDIYDWKQIGEAHTSLESRNSKGKILLKISS